MAPLHQPRGQVWVWVLQLVPRLWVLLPQPSVARTWLSAAP